LPPFGGLSRLVSLTQCTICIAGCNGLRGLLGRLQVLLSHPLDPSVWAACREEAHTRSLMERGPKKRPVSPTGPRGAEAVPAVLGGFNEQDLAMKLLPYLPLRELAVVAMVSRSWRTTVDPILRRLHYALWVAPLRQRLDFSGQIMPAEAANLGLDKLLNNLIVLNGLRHR
jgi:hypothetical protein